MTRCVGDGSPFNNDMWMQINRLKLMRKHFTTPIMDALHRSYEKVFFYNAPRGRSRKIRLYEHIDITREFEIL